VRLVHCRHFDDLPLQQLEAAIAEDAGVDGAVIFLECPAVRLRRDQLPRLVSGGHSGSSIVSSLMYSVRTFDYADAGG
jgi:hypothetical protein